jgi:hypothetical protein
MGALFLLSMFRREAARFWWGVWSRSSTVTADMYDSGVAAWQQSRSTVWPCSNKTSPPNNRSSDASHFYLRFWAYPVLHCSDWTPQVSRVCVSLLI